MSQRATPLHLIAKLGRWAFTTRDARRRRRPIAKCSTTGMRPTARRSITPLSSINSEEVAELSVTDLKTDADKDMKRTGGE